MRQPTLMGSGSTSKQPQWLTFAHLQKEMVLKWPAKTATRHTLEMGLHIMAIWL